MSTKKDTVWPAPAHTLAKIRILESYLYPYFQIVGRTFNDPIIYVDGFAGPGEYTNSPTGSPIAALRAIHKVLSASGQDIKTPKFLTYFIEADLRRYEHLLELVEPYRHSRIQIRCIHGSFNDVMEDLKTSLGRGYYSWPAFYFIDPFGPTAVPFARIGDILSNKRAELLLNLDADGIARIFSAGEISRASDNLKLVFGNDVRSAFENVSSHAARSVVALQQYKQELASAEVDYRFAFEMRNKSDLLEYFLLFATHHPTGLEKMKEAMKSIAGDSSYKFSDVAAGQHDLFSANDEEYYSTEMAKSFKGKSATYSEVARFALNETPFVNPKAMLKKLEAAGGIMVTTVASQPRRPGTFKEDKILNIRFLSNEDLFN